MKKIPTMLMLVLSAGLSIANAAQPGQGMPLPKPGPQQDLSNPASAQNTGAFSPIINAANGEQPDWSGRPQYGGSRHPGGHYGGHNDPYNGPMPPVPQPWYPQPPMPQPQPWYPPQPYPSQAASLGGYCQDYDHSQFIQAKNFAYSGSGLNYYSNEAANWAILYLQTHACGTIPEYAARYTELYDYSYGGSYMNMTVMDARNYALNYVEYMNVPQIRVWKQMFQAVYQLFYSGSYMNNTASGSAAAARAWNERGYCGDMRTVEYMKAEYSHQYNFAYSGSGLNLSSQSAKEYALGSVRRMTPCGDLLR